jgi:hypothetical protein
MWFWGHVVEDLEVKHCIKTRNSALVTGIPLKLSFAPLEGGLSHCPDQPVFSSVISPQVPGIVNLVGRSPQGETELPPRALCFPGASRTPGPRFEITTSQTIVLPSLSHCAYFLPPTFVLPLYSLKTCQYPRGRI